MHLPWLLVDLAEFRLVLGHGIAGAVEYDEACASGALVDGANEALLQVVVAMVLILQQRPNPDVGLLWANLDLEFLGVLGLSIDAFTVQLERVSHLLEGWKGGMVAEEG